MRFDKYDAFALGALVLGSLYYAVHKAPSQKNYQDGESPEIQGIRGSTVTLSGAVGGHYYVDLGLPSGTLWATCNLGAGGYYEMDESLLSDYVGGYYEWGATKADSIQNSSDDFAYDGDAVPASWSFLWRTPTPQELQELIDGCEWTVLNYKLNGENDYLRDGSEFNDQPRSVEGVSKTNGNHIVMPYGDYWSSELVELQQDYANSAHFEGCEHGMYLGSRKRHYGLHIRPVVAIMPDSASK